MKELSLHILDIVQNSVKAGASIISIVICEEINDNILSITIEDNGCGMSSEFVRNVCDPFVTTRTTRKVGMGISLFKLASESANGNFAIQSKINEGTKVTATFEYNHIDRAPLGDMASTMSTIIGGAKDVDFLYTHKINDKTFVLDTKQLRSILGGVDLDTPDVLVWIDEYVKENIAELAN